jgi:hypothetical protein
VRGRRLSRCRHPVCGAAAAAAAEQSLLLQAASVTQEAAAPSMARFATGVGARRLCIGGDGWGPGPVLRRWSSGSGRGARMGAVRGRWLPWGPACPRTLLGACRRPRLGRRPGGTRPDRRARRSWRALTGELVKRVLAAIYQEADGRPAFSSACSSSPPSPVRPTSEARSSTASSTAAKVRFTRLADAGVRCGCSTPERSGSFATATGAPRSPRRGPAARRDHLHAPTDELVESPLRGNAHGGFGGAGRRNGPLREHGTALRPDPTIRAVVGCCAAVRSAHGSPSVEWSSSPRGRR